VKTAENNSTRKAEGEREPCMELTTRKHSKEGNKK